MTKWICLGLAIGLLLVVGCLMGRYADRAQEERVRFGKRWGRFDRKKLRKRLRARLSAFNGEVAAAPPQTAG